MAMPSFRSWSLDSGCALFVTTACGSIRRRVTPRRAAIRASSPKVLPPGKPADAEKWAASSAGRDAVMMPSWRTPCGAVPRWWRVAKQVRARD